MNWKGPREIQWESLVCISESVSLQGTIKCMIKEWESLLFLRYLLLLTGVDNSGNDRSAQHNVFYHKNKNE